MPGNVISVEIDERVWREFEEIGGGSEAVNEALKIYAGILKGVCVAVVSGKKKRRLVRIDEVKDLSEIFEPPLTMIYPIFEFTPEVLKKVADLAFKYVDEDYDDPDSSPAVGVRAPGAPEEKYLLGEAKNPETFVMYLLGGYTGTIRIRFEEKTGFVSFLEDSIVIDAF